MYLDFVEFSYMLDAIPSNSLIGTSFDIVNITISPRLLFILSGSSYNTC